MTRRRFYLSLLASFLVPILMHQAFLRWGPIVPTMRSTIQLQRETIANQRAIIDMQDQAATLVRADSAWSDSLRIQWRETAERCGVILDSVSRGQLALRPVHRNRQVTP